MCIKKCHTYICLFVCLFIYLFIYLFVCLFVCLFVLYIYFVFPCFCILLVYLNSRSAQFVSVIWGRDIYGYNIYVIYTWYIRLWYIRDIYGYETYVIYAWYIRLWDIFSVAHRRQSISYRPGISWPRCTTWSRSASYTCCRMF